MADISPNDLQTLIATLQNTNTQLGQIIRAINHLQEALAPGTPFVARNAMAPAPRTPPPETPAATTG